MPSDAPDAQSPAKPREGPEAPERNAFEKAWQARFVQFATLREDDAGIAGWSTTGLETRFRCFRDLWRGAKSGALYFDVGCGAGTYSRWLAEQGLNVVGVDYSNLSLVKAKRRATDRIAYCAADAAHLPFATASADGALCFGVLQAVWDSRAIVAELARVVRPGGEVWIDALNAANLAARWDGIRRRLKGKRMHLRYESSGTLLDVMRHAGFQDLSRQWLIIVPNRLAALRSIAESDLVRWLLGAAPGLGSLASHSVVIRGIRGHGPDPARQAEVRGAP